MSDIKHQAEISKGIFTFKLEDQIVGEMTYSRAGTDKLIIDHTLVSQDKQGQGIGAKLVEAAVEYARENEKKIVPLCPFAAKIFERKGQEYADVLS